MASNNNSSMMFGVLGLAAIGGAALIYSRKAHASESGKTGTTTPADTVPQDEIPDVLPDGPHATVGSPYQPGEANLGKNVAIAVATRPSIHPTGLSRAKLSWDNWLANVVYWETWPTAPIKVPSTSHPSAPLWTRAHTLVLAALKDGTNPNKSDKDKTPIGHATIGEPFRAGEPEHNAEQAVKLKPNAHPAGGKQKPGQKIGDWLTNIAFWESYPLAPIELKGSKGHDADNWRALSAMIAKLLATPDTPKKDPKKEDGLFPSLGAPYRPGSDQERNNAALAVKFQPLTHPRGETGKGKTLVDWLTNVAFWETWPVAPTKLASSKGGLADSWRRIKGHVQTLLRAKTTPKTTPTTKTTTPTTTPTKKTTPTTKTTTPTKKTTPTTKTTTPTKKTTPASEPGWFAGDIASNVKKAVSENPQSYAGRSRESGQKPEVWLANVVYWSTYPDAPVTIETGDKQNVLRWTDAKNRIVAAVKAKAKTSTPTTKTTTPTTKTTTPVALSYVPGDVENNARKVAAERPQVYLGQKPKPGQKQRDWLANVVYWSTYPDAPIKIDGKDKVNVKRWLDAQDRLGMMGVAGESRLDSANEVRSASLAVSRTEPGPEFVRRAASEAFRAVNPGASSSDPQTLMSGRRILQYVQRGAALAKVLSGPPENWPLSKDSWLPWAIVMANSSGLRRPEEIAQGAELASKYLSENPQAAGDASDLGPVLAETAHAIILGKPLRNLDVTQYPDTLAYMAASELT